MRKNVALFVIFCFSVLMFQSTTGAFAENVPMCRLMHNPVSDEGVINKELNCIFTLQQPVSVLMYDGDGNLSTCKLGAGISIVTDKQSGNWLWVRACSNYFPQGFVHPLVKGVLDCFPQQVEQPKISLILSGAPYTQPEKEQAKEQLVQKTNRGLSTGTKVVIGVVAAIAIAALIKSMSKGNSQHGPANPPPIQ